jgi:outer membrane protein TolC
LFTAILAAIGMASFLVRPLLGQEIGTYFRIAELTPAEAIAPGPAASRRLTLEEAKQIALATNKALVLAHLNVDEKRYVTSAATKDYFPKILGCETYFHFDNPLGSVVTTRGVVLPALVSVNVVNQDAALTTTMVAQPITKLIAVNAMVQIDRADENIAKAKLDKGTRDLLSGVTQVYYGLVGALRIQSALQLQGTMLEQAVAAQPTPEMRISLVEVRQGIVQVNGQVHELVDQLDDLLDFPPGTVIEVVDPVPEAPPVMSADQAGQMALMCNPEVHEAEQAIAKAEAALKVARMDYLPDVNIIGGYANQTDASYIQSNFTYLGITANYTFWEWGKKNDVTLQRQTDIALARQNLQVTRDKVQLEARKSYVAFDQALQAYRLSGEMVQACQDAEKGATGQAAVTTKGATAKAQLEYMKDEITYRVAHAQLVGALGMK